MRCSRCGFNNGNNRQTCVRCGLQLPLEPALARNGQTQLTRPAPPAAPPAPVRRYGLSTIHAQQQALAAPTRQARQAMPWRQIFAPRPALTGTVIAIEPAHEEPDDWNWPSFINRMLLLVEFIGLPVVLLWSLLMLGPLSIILAVLALIFLFKFVSPTGIFNTLRIFRFLNPIPRRNLVPVQYFRVRSGLQREYIVRRKGVLHGHLMAGDEVVLWGRFRHGVIHLSHGQNIRTRASLVVPRNRSWAFLALHLTILALVIGAFYQPIKNTLGVLT